MHPMLRLSVTALVVVALAYLGDPVSAQAPVKIPLAPVQIKLSEKQIEGFISAHKDISEAFDKLTAENSSDAAAQRQLNSIAKKFGFKNYNEYESVDHNIALVMFGIDPQTKAFTDPPALVKKQLEDAMADKSLPEKERKQLVEELTVQLKTVEPIRHPGNIELVKKYYDKLQPLLP